MTRKWSNSSQIVYNQLDDRLKTLVTRIRDEVADISLTSSYRDADEQNALYAMNVTQVKWPNSKHNTRPCKAIDLQPYPYPKYEPKLWGALGYIAGHAMRIAQGEGFKIRWGGDWNGDGDTTNQKFDDLFHLEIVDD